MGYRKTAETTSHAIDNKIVNVVANSYDHKVTKVSKISSQNNLETITNEYDKEKPKGKYIYIQKKYRKLLII